MGVRKYLLIKDARKYLLIKNAIISLLLTVMYLRWLVEGMHPIKIIICCIMAFWTFIELLQIADDCYIRVKKRECTGRTTIMHSTK